MGNALQLVCDSCGARLRVGARLVGRTVICPKCNGAIPVQNNPPPPPRPATKTQTIVAAARRHLATSWPTWLIVAGIAVTWFTGRYFDSAVWTYGRCISAISIIAGASLLARRQFDGTTWRWKFTLQPAKSFVRSTWPAWCISAALVAWFLLTDVQSSRWFLLRYVAIAAVGVGIIGSANPAFYWSWKRFAGTLLAAVAILALSMDIILHNYGWFDAWWMIGIFLCLFLVVFILVGYAATLLSAVVVRRSNRKLSVRWTRLIGGFLTLFAIVWWGFHDTYVES
jgi:hypothetical protein